MPAANCDDPGALRSILNLWLDAGADLGNHTFTHPDINDVPLAQYTADIVKGEPELKRRTRGAWPEARPTSAIPTCASARRRK